VAALDWLAALNDHALHHAKKILLPLLKEIQA